MVTPNSHLWPCQPGLMGVTKGLTQPPPPSATSFRNLLKSWTLIAISIPLPPKSLAFWLSWLRLSLGVISSLSHVRMVKYCGAGWRRPPRGAWNSSCSHLRPLTEFWFEKGDILQETTTSVHHQPPHGSHFFFRASTTPSK